jgi:hypothetical protein
MSSIPQTSLKSPQSSPYLFELLNVFINDMVVGVVFILDDALDLFNLSPFHLCPLLELSLQSLNLVTLILFNLSFPLTASIL